MVRIRSPHPIEIGAAAIDTMIPVLPIGAFVGWTQAYSIRWDIFKVEDRPKVTTQGLKICGRVPALNQARVKSCAESILWFAARDRRYPSPNSRYLSNTCRCVTTPSN